jgi:hypothetical protein
MLLACMQEFYRLMQEILATDEESSASLAQAIDYLWKLAETESGPGNEVNAEVLAKVRHPVHTYIVHAWCLAFFSACHPQADL